MRFIAVLSLLATAFCSSLTLAQSPSDDSKDVVILGDPALTAGVPGVGILTPEALDAWLSNPANHRTLKVQLP